MRIAIIGSGIAGNTVAWRLHRQHDITVFEAGSHIGGHTHTHDIEHEGQRYAIDTGFIVFNEKTYPHFIDMLDTLGVASQPSSMSFSVRCETSGLEYNGNTLNSLFAQRRNLLRPSFHRMIRDILRFNRESLTLLEADQEVRLGSYLEAHGYSAAFINYYIIPMGAAIWSTAPQRMLDFPARFFVRFFHHHGMLSVDDRPQWRVIEGGSARYVETLTREFRSRIRLDTPIVRVQRNEHAVLITPRHGPEERFDWVFFACHSDQALAMLGPGATAAEHEILGAIPYQENHVVLHTDRNLMPRCKRAWAAWNYHVPAQAGERVAVTYNMNILQGLHSREPLLVTLNHTQGIAPDKIVKRLTYHHPLYTAAGAAAQRRHHEISGVNRTAYCGAYWRNGFHEDGVVSALAALHHFETALPHA